MNQDIDLETLHDQVNKLQSIVWAAQTLKKHGQTELSATMELIVINHQKISEMLFPADFPDTPEAPELLTPHTP